MNPQTDFTLVVGNVSYQMVWVPLENDAPGFWIGRELVPQALWLAVMLENPSWSCELSQPVTNVSWYDITRFFLVSLRDTVRKSMPWACYDLRMPTSDEFIHAHNVLQGELNEWCMDTRSTATAYTFGEIQDLPILRPASHRGPQSGRGRQAFRVGLPHISSPDQGFRLVYGLPPKIS